MIECCFYSCIIDVGPFGQWLVESFTMLQLCVVYVCCWSDRFPPFFKRTIFISILNFSKHVQRTHTYKIHIHISTNRSSLSFVCLHSNWTKMFQLQDGSDQNNLEDSSEQTTFEMSFSDSKTFNGFLDTTWNGDFQRFVRCFLILRTFLRFIRPFLRFKINNLNL